MSQDRFWERPLDTLDRAEWEALCDGCGKCCLHKVEEETDDGSPGTVWPTNVACRLLDCDAAHCTAYPQRKRFVPDCLTLTKENVRQISWLPRTCAYRLRAAGRPLPRWHYLVCGDREAVHRVGESVRGWVISETLAGPIEHHIVERDL